MDSSDIIVTLNFPFLFVELSFKGIEAILSQSLFIMYSFLVYVCQVRL